MWDKAGEKGIERDKAQGSREREEGGSGCRGAGRRVVAVSKREDSEVKRLKTGGSYTVGRHVRRRRTLQQ
jgi:hypothetical protein